MLLGRLVEVVEVHLQRHGQQGVHVHARGEGRLRGDAIGPVSHPRYQLDMDSRQPPEQVGAEALDGLPQGVDVRRVEIPVAGHRNSEGYLSHARHGTWTRGVRQHLPGGHLLRTAVPRGTGKSNL